MGGCALHRKMGERPALTTADLLAAEVWAYTPPHESNNCFTGKRRRSKGQEEERFARRLELFSRFDEGIQLDDDMWWSVTPEQLAVHTAERCSCDLLLDGFAGAGGNSIAFARTCGFVIACEIDAARVETAKANAGVYGRQILSRLDFVCGDFATLTSRQLRKDAIDVVFMAPPWGGPSYNASEVFDLTSMGAKIDFRHSMRLAQRVAPRVAAFLPRTVPLLPLLREVAFFHMRQEGAATAALRPEAFRGTTASLTAVKQAQPGDKDFLLSEAPRRFAGTPPRIHIELAFRRSHLESRGRISFDCPNSYKEFQHLAAGLHRVLGKASSQGDAVESLSSDLTAEEGTAEPAAKRRNVTRAGPLEMAEEPVIKSSSHSLRWEAAEAANEELHFIKALKELSGSGDSAAFAAVMKRPALYPEVCETSLEWRLLPVHLLWAAAPLTKGLIKNPLARLNKRLRAFREAEEGASAPSESEEDCVEPPLMPALKKSLVPCACSQMRCWRWRALGVTAYFGNFAGLSSSAPRPESRCEAKPCLQVPFVMTEGDSSLPPPRMQQNPQQQAKLREKERRQRIKMQLEALLRDCLQFVGNEAPGSPWAVASAAAEVQDEPKGEKPQNSGSFAQEAADAETDSEATESSAGGVTQASAQPLAENCAVTNRQQMPSLQGLSRVAASSSVACFTRQLFSPCGRKRERLCNCFYSQQTPAKRQTQKTQSGADTGGRQDVGHDEKHGDDSGCSGQMDWGAFVRRLVSSASRELFKSQEACACRKCNREEGSPGCSAESHSARRCALSRSGVWSICKRLLHTFLAGASGCTATLRVAVAVPISKKKKKKQKSGQRWPTVASPVRPEVRSEFLRRVADAYEAFCWEETGQDSFFAKGGVPDIPPKDSPIDGTEAGTEQQKTRESENQSGSSHCDMWTGEEVLHWQFGCSMWCNSGLRVLVAQHVASLLKEPSTACLTS